MAMVAFEEGAAEVLFVVAGVAELAEAVGVGPPEPAAGGEEVDACVALPGAAVADGVVEAELEFEVDEELVVVGVELEPPVDEPAAPGEARLEKAVATSEEDR
jgi:hypothetical protein